MGRERRAGRGRRQRSSPPGRACRRRGPARRHWPGEGARHNAARAIGGLLARGGWSAPEAKLFIQAVAKAAGDEEWQDRERAVSDSFDTVARGDRTTGLPTLAEAVGEKVARRAFEWLGLSARRRAPGNGTDPADDWRSRCIRGDYGEILPIIANALIAMRADPTLKEIVALDEMMRAPIFMHPIGGKAPGFTPRPVTDADVTLLQEALQHAGLPRLTKDCVHQAVDVRAVECAFHPVRDYLNALEWDGAPRLPTWLAKYFGADEGEYGATIGTMFMVAMVARVFKPGVKADYMPCSRASRGR